MKLMLDIEMSGGPLKVLRGLAEEAGVPLESALAAAVGVGLRTLATRAEVVKRIERVSVTRRRVPKALKLVKFPPKMPES